MVERTGSGDPLRVIPLLWRQGVRTGRTGLTIDDIVEQGIALADEIGIENLSMRKLADRLGIGAMTLYAHLPGKAELIELMVDSALGEVDDAASPARADWRAALTAVADANRRLLTRHRWLIDVDTTRPPLGPGTIAKYDAELHALVGTGLDDVEIDQALTLVLEHVRSSTRQVLSAASPEVADGDWWERAGPVLEGVLDPAAYPLASRVGQAAGETYGAAADPERAYTFGLQTILDGIEALIARKAT